MSRKISVPVNKENVLKYGILDEKYADMIPDEIVLTMSKDKDAITKQELFMLDLLSNYQWDRPINMLNMGGDLNMGIKDYLQYEGFSYKFVPIKNRTRLAEPGFTDADELYRKITETYKWDALGRTDYYVDYHHFYTFCGVSSQRGMFVIAAREMVKAGRNDRALEMLDKCMEVIPEENFPLGMMEFGFTNEQYVLEIISMYYELGQPEKGRAIADRFTEEMMQSAVFYLQFYGYARDMYEDACRYVFYAADIMNVNGDTERSDEIVAELNAIVGAE